MNDTSNYRTLGLQIGACIGGMASLTLKSNIIEFFFIALAIGGIIGSLYGDKMKREVL